MIQVKVNQYCPLRIHMDSRLIRPHFSTTCAELNHTGLKRKVTNPRRNTAIRNTAISHAFDRLRFSSLATSTLN